MSVQVLGWIWKQVLHPTDKLALLAIGDNANDEGKHAYAAQATLAAGEESKTGLSERAFRNACRHLRHHGWLAWVQQGSEWGTNLYTVNLQGGTRCRLARTACIAALADDPPNPKAAPGAAPRRHEMPPKAARGAALRRHEVPPNRQKEPSENRPTASPAAPRLRLAASNDTPDPAPANGGPVTAQQLIAEHVEALGFRPATIGQLSAVTKRLLDRDRKPPALIRAGLDLMRRKRLTSPSVLPALIDEVQAAQIHPPGPARPVPPAEVADRPLPDAPREEWEAWGRRHHPDLFKDGGPP